MRDDNREIFTEELIHWIVDCDGIGLLCVQHLLLFLASSSRLQMDAITLFCVDGIFQYAGLLSYSLHVGG